MLPWGSVLSVSMAAFGRGADFDLAGIAASLPTQLQQRFKPNPIMGARGMGGCVCGADRLGGSHSAPRRLVRLDARGEEFWGQNMTLASNFCKEGSSSTIWTVRTDEQTTYVLFIDGAYHDQNDGDNWLKYRQVGKLAVYVSYATPLVPRVWLDRNKTDVPAEAFPPPAELRRSGRPSHRPLPAAVTAEVSGLSHYYKLTCLDFAQNNLWAVADNLG